MNFKKSLNFCFVDSYATYKSRKKSFAQFSIALLMQVTKRNLTQFLDNFWAKIFYKHWGRVKIKVSDLPRCMGPGLYGWWEGRPAKSKMAYHHPNRITPTKKFITIQRGQDPPTRVVTDFQTPHYFFPPQCF